MDRSALPKEDFVQFLKWCLPGLDLRWSGFRKVHGTVRKRVARRMRELGLPTIEAYRERLESDPSEWLELDRFCRIPISRFFRDKAVFETLAFEVLARGAAAVRERGGRKLKVLSAGCAAGEEPYTISLIWRLYVMDQFPGVDLEVLAVDIDDAMLQRARTACYSFSSFRDLPSELIERGFSRSNDEYCLRDSFREGIRLEKADLRVEMPAGPFDLILCRNTVFTYFDERHQARAFEKIDIALRDAGFLVIGSHETLPPPATGFVRIRPGLPVFRKLTEKDSDRKPDSQFSPSTAPGNSPVS